ncbi:DNA cytosine methyltransferase [Clostridium sp. M14]|uniref:DNA cytosine methyltransferase n=1 Tax=Clostridium sp. M14 TaxID=2716311 RepID=UPI0013EE4191|nr:DNA cytosine methyltransferase [Clostridium sp. M14]MBZ9693270.1 DNA cytosine methyltransferase [Clostridium sp. M14]
MKQLKVLDLFSGTQSIAKQFRKRGHLTYTVELDKEHKGIDWYENVMNIEAKDILERFGQPDVMWISPPCEKFSVASIGRYWTKGSNIPSTEESKKALQLLEHSIKLMKDLNPTYYFIENPRGKMRKMDCMQELSRYTVTYCQYGDTRMKPTDLWTNHPNPDFKPPCKNGDPCHISAPRGSRTGTQGCRDFLIHIK